MQARQPHFTLTVTIALFSSSSFFVVYTEKMCDSLPRISLLTKPVKIDQSDGIPDPGIPE